MRAITDFDEILNSSSVAWLGFKGAMNGSGSMCVRYKSDLDKVYRFDDVFWEDYSEIKSGGDVGSVGKAMAAFRKRRKAENGNQINGEILSWDSVKEMFGLNKLAATEKERILSVWDSDDETSWFEVGYAFL